MQQTTRSTKLLRRFFFCEYWSSESTFYIAAHMAAFITVKELMQGNSQVPYTKSFKVLVVCKDPEKMYVNEAKEERFLINCVVADATKAVKCTVYDRTKFSRFQEGNTIIIRNVIKKTDNIVVTANSKVFPTGNIEVPQDVVDEGRRLLHPPAAEVKTVAEAVSSPPRVRVIVQGKLTQEEATREVMVNNQPVKVKNVYIEDRTAKCKVALWRSFTQEPVRPGEYVEITDLVTNVYRNEVSLQTTVRSSIKVMECPVETKEYEVLSACKDEKQITLLLENDQILDISLPVVKETFPDIPDTFIEEHIQKMCNPSVTATCCMKNDMVFSIKFQE